MPDPRRVRLSLPASILVFAAGVTLVGVAPVDAHVGIAHVATVDPEPVAPEPEPEPEPDPEPDPDDPGEPGDEDESGGSTLVGAGNPSGEIDSLYAVIGVVGFLVLMGFAIWWMLRRKNPDAVPMPPRSGIPPPSDLI